MDTNHRTRTSTRAGESASQSSQTPPRPHISLVGVSPSDDLRCPDELLLQSIHDSLNSMGIRQFNALEVEVSEGRVKMSGKVGRYYWRQLAENAVLKTIGVLELDSQLVVARA
jgi:hypothetical protein